MKFALSLALGFAFYLIIAVSYGELIYSVIGPKVISPYSNYQARVTIEDSERTQIKSRAEEVKVQLALVSKQKTYYQSNPVSIIPGSSELVSIPIGYLDKNKEYNITFTGYNSNVEQAIFEDYIYARIQRKTKSVFVQTDKVIYKPGETIRLRVIVLDRNLKPFPANKTTKVNILLFDEQRNIIKSWKKQQITNGLYSTNFKLSTEPVLGTWKFEINTESNKDSNHNVRKIHTISIEQYILPKFNVEIKFSHPFVTFNDSKMVVTINASYTYGKPINAGNAIVSIHENYRHNNGISKALQVMNGIAHVEFDIVKDLSLNGESERKIIVHASVIEKLTGKRQNSTNSFMLYKHPFKLQLLPGAKYYKPGFPLQITILVTTQDNIPITDPNPNALTVRHGFSYLHEGSIYKSSIPKTGLVTFIFNASTNELYNTNAFEARYKGVTQWFNIPEKITTVSRTYLHLTVLKVPDGIGTMSPYQIDSASVGQTVSFQVESNKMLNFAVHYQLVGANQLLNYGILNLTSNSTRAIINLVIPAEAAPKSRLIAYTTAEIDHSFNDDSYLDDDGIVKRFQQMQSPRQEIIADSITINTNPAFVSHLNLTLSNSTVEPGQNIQLHIKTKPKSLVALRGIDQSVLLLKEDKDLTLKDVNEELERYDTSDYYNYGSTKSVFFKAGLFILTNAAIHKPSSNYYYGTWHSLYGYGWGSYSSKGGGKKQRQAVRTHFPETWLWEETHCANDTTSLSKLVPDTLTSWVITGYSINSEFGLALLDKPEKFTVIRPFFITLNIPYSAIQNEILAIQVLVHNYLEHEAKVEITLDNSKGQFDIISNNGTGNQQQNLNINSSDVSTVTFIIKPKIIGILELNVKAITNFAGDALSRPLIIKPPGQQQFRNKVVLIDHRKQNSSEMVLNTFFPESRVIGADSVKLSVVADILGATISNLHNLLKMPYGCGEQYLINFVPDIIILDYLTATNSLTPEIKSKAISYLESGYQRQLTFLHNDGSFTAFGKSDEHGSTWLTAFVIKSFYAAKRYITIDNSIIENGLDFLEEQQRENGTFEEHGRALLPGLQDGSNNGGVQALTAYTVITFIETAIRNRKNRSEYDHIIEKALDALTASSTSIIPNTYALALTAYALTLANHPKKNYFNSLLEEQAISTTDGQFKYWEQKAEKEEPETKRKYTVKPKRTRPIRSHRKETKPIAVEITSYVLLNYLHQSKIGESLPLVKWLLSKRNAEGGFISTQDTIVGLTALAKFATLTYDKEVDLVINAKYGNDEESQVINVNKDNSIVYQQFEFPSTTEQVKLEVAGNGIALVQLTNSYYVNDVDRKQAFFMDVKVLPTMKIKELVLEVCTKFNRNDKTTSNMAVVEINLPTGFIFDNDYLEQLLKLPRVMRYDLAEADTQLNIYYDSLNNEPSCVVVYANLIYRATKQAPAYVLAYDYYDTTRTGKTFYQALEFEFCELEGADKENCV